MIAHQQNRGEHRERIAVEEKYCSQEIRRSHKSAIVLSSAPDGQVLFVGDRNAHVHPFSGFSAVYLMKPSWRGGG